ncbi:MAG: hypothetical protein MN733_43425, partial [Nitrososphaera sp.]|nr:hypothetical protein [Nitrososphaera sp.]
MQNYRTVWISGWKGYSDVSYPDDNPTVTNDESNVKTVRGLVKMRGGMTKYQSVSTPASADIIGLYNFRRVSGTHLLCRLMTTVFEYYSSGWTVKTGTALTATNTARPQADIIDDHLVFTNGVDLPRKFDGTNNTSSIASGTSPYSKGVVAYLGFLFLFDASLTGTFTDVENGYRLGYYSDDWDTDWTGCDGNTITLDETPGKWLGAMVLDRVMYCLKSDGVVAVTWVGGPTRFRQDLISSDVGGVSGLTMAKAGERAIFFLGTDGIIYAITRQGVEAISYESLSKVLPDTFSLNRLQFARA